MKNKKLIDLLSKYSPDCDVHIQQLVTTNNKHCPMFYKPITSIHFDEVKNRVVITNDVLVVTNDEDHVILVKPIGEIPPSKRNDFDLEGWAKYRLQQ